eukprot:scaffold25842_cov198-Amphora_coffeaeformis.AAC.34
MWFSRFFLSVLLVVTTFTSVQAFGPFGQPRQRTAAPPKKITQVDTAVAIYQKKYPPNRRSRKRAFNANLGMPRRDLDGTPLKVAQTRDMGPTFSDRPEADLQATYSALSKYFGDEAALQMVRDFPLVLAMDRSNLIPNMDAYSATFGTEDAAAMVRRNPGLLFCKPDNAAEADDLTMKFSYIIAFTRPLGPVWLYGLLLLLLEPAFERISGIALKAMLFSSSGSVAVSSPSLRCQPAASSCVGRAAAVV